MNFFTGIFQGFLPKIYKDIIKNKRQILRTPIFTENLSLTACELCYSQNFYPYTARTFSKTTSSPGHFCPYKVVAPERRSANALFRTLSSRFSLVIVNGNGL